jgi:serine/threonine protein kinase/WD40 repeat protein
MALASGTRLGPYEIVEPLGSGGMGEVYRARDPRLGREVAIKLVATDGPPSPDRLRRFETEARAAASLSHPNVVTVFDVGTHDGHPYLVLELLEGETLRETLRSGVPSLRQAARWALEISRGLAAAHERGIVHRDLKPENVFLTSDGRLKVLDFGLAKLHETLVSDEADRESPTATKGTSPGVLLGTIGYMSPEQVKGETPDARTDVFALGTVLYELVTGRKAFGGGTAPEVLASILRDEPPALESQVHGVPGSLEAVVRRCLGKRPSDRFSSARGVEAALETVLAGLEPSRVSAARPLEPRGPYPGLSSFTEADAGRFFGREAEVESLWAKLRQRTLLALIGPSGAGKTSFVRAGLVPSRPSGWGAIVATPGGAPMRSLAQALVEVLPSDADTVKQLLGFEDPDVAFSMVRKWRESHLEAVLVVDQFEELFTLNPPEVQERFAVLLRRLAGEGDLHVLLSLRDDFLIRCHEQKPLEAVFQNLTPILALGGEDLRRALTEPAQREGYAFEDEHLVAEMLESLEGARGALPLLAFAVARLWEKRDRERKLLTRTAYEEIGGVAGALAQHAEQTLERIGLEREPIVRELFRNLVTAQWTRASADREELLSVLPDREAGGRVLDQLIDARLLTSYEVREGEASAGRSGSGAHARDGIEAERSSEALSGVTSVSRHRIEIAHESLLRAWPRLVRWQAQDEEGAVLRDQLKQAAHLWDEKSRSVDLLWSGDAFQEFDLWRRRYPGALTALEEDFATAMAQRAARQKRRRRAMVSAIVTASLAVASVTGTLWRRARAEALRAEAGKLLALGQNHLEDDPTAALAYTRGSLELWDTFEARRFAVEILWRGPVARVLDLGRAARQLALPGGWRGSNWIAISPDGRWLAATSGRQVLLVPGDGGPARALPVPPDSRSLNVVAFGARSDLLITGSSGASLRLWSLPDLREVRTIELPGFAIWAAAVRGDRILATEQVAEGSPETVTRLLELPGGELKETVSHAGESPSLSFDERGERMIVTRGRTLALRFLDGTNRLQVLGEVPDGPRLVGLSPSGDLVVTTDLSGESRIWSTAGDAREPLRVLRGPALGYGVPMLFDPREQRLSRPGRNGTHVLRDLDEFPDAEPLVFGRPGPSNGSRVAYDPSGRWLAAGETARTTIDFWPVTGPRRRVFPGVVGAQAQAFTPDGHWLATCPNTRPARLWPSRARPRGPAVLPSRDGSPGPLRRRHLRGCGRFPSRGRPAPPARRRGGGATGVRPAGPPRGRRRRLQLLRAGGARPPRVGPGVRS